MPGKRVRVLKYRDLKKIQTGTSQEPLVSLNAFCPDIACCYQKRDMYKYLGNQILVRKRLAGKLGRANLQLGKLLPGAKLRIVYGYRHPEVQKKYFDRIMKEISGKYKRLGQNQLIALAHNFVASPDVAGHTTGGAIDVTIEKNGRELNLGTRIADYSNPEKIKTFSRTISQEQARLRKLLHDVLLKQGLAPFYGEWWHFSYGDREWACFYGKKRALYAEVDLRSPS